MVDEATTLRCASCGYETTEKMKFCPECGGKLEPKGSVTKSTARVATRDIGDKSKYNPKFRQILLFETVCAAAGLAFACLCIFLRIFSCDLRIFIFGDSLSDIDIRDSFSLFDLFREMIYSFKNSDIDYDFGTRFYSFIIVIYLFALAIWSLVQLIISIARIVSIEDYYLSKYNDLVTNNNPNARRRTRSPLSLFISAIVLFAFVLIFDKMPYVGSDMFQGVTGLIAFVIISGAVYGVSAIAQAIQTASIKKDYLREINR